MVLHLKELAVTNVMMYLKLIERKDGQSMMPILLNNVNERAILNVYKSKQEKDAKYMAFYLSTK
jgi:hypothetical protein